MIGTLRIADMPILLEKTKLEDVQKRFGGMLGNHGDGGDSLAWLCYRGSDASGDWVFWLTSGELNGLTWIDGVQWRQLSGNERPDHRCRTLPGDAGGIKLPVPLHLGSSAQEVQQALGRPTLARHHTLYFDHEHPVTIRKERYSVWNGVAVVIVRGSVRGIDVSHTTSN
jgi:hypothetical protein